MKTNENIPRFLGAAFLIVVLTSLISGLTLTSVVGSGTISEILVNISQNPSLMRISSFSDLVTSLGIVVLAALLYIVLHKQNKIVALVALGWWLVEAVTLAVSKTGDFALIPLSLEFIESVALEHSYYQTLGKFLYYGIARQGYTIHMLFYCTGGLLWYYLFYKSKYIPRAISLFGLIAVSAALVGNVLEFAGYDVPIFVSLPILPFEITIGIWLMIKGISTDKYVLKE